MPGAEAPKKAAKPKRKSLRPDLATILGIALALAGILGGLILEKGRISDVMQGTAAMIVLGGTFGAVLVTNPLHVVARSFRALGSVFFEEANGAAELIENVIGYAT